MPDMPENFFEPGKPSHCIFSPDLNCDVYLPFSPFAPADFLCKVEPLRVGVILPESEGDFGKIWDEVYERIASVWQSRQVGFRCHRSSPEAWTQAKPCDACAMAREAQVVIIDLDGGNLRAQSFRDMANASTTTLQMIKAMNPVGAIPGKLVVLISCGPMNLPAHIQRAFYCVDYAGADGAPNLDLLTLEMEAITHAAGLFQEGDVLSLDLSDLDGDKVQPPVAPAAAAAPEPSLEDLVKILSDTEASPPAAELKSRDVLAEARKLVQRKSFAAALRELQSVGDILPAERAAWRELVSKCLASRLSSHEIVEAFYGSGRERGRLSLSAWSTKGEPSSAILRVDDGGLARQLGAGEVPLYAFERLEPEAVNTIYRSLVANPAGPKTALTIARECEENAGRLLLEAAGSEVPLRLVEVRLADVEEQLLAHGTPLDHLKERTRPAYRRDADPFLEGIHRVVCGESFFGRGQLLQKLAGFVRAGESFVVYGLPRAGKSSLLRQLMLLSQGNGNLPVLVDLPAHPPRQLSELYQLIVRSVRQALSSPGPGSPAVEVKHLRLFSLEATAPTSIFHSSFVDDLKELASSLPEPGRLLLLFDEIDFILPDKVTHFPGIDGHREFLEQLRLVVDQNHVVLAIGGFCAALRQEMSEGGCPLYDRVHELPIGALTDSECSMMIRTLGKRTYSYFRDDALATILQASGKDPLLAKYLSSAALETSGASSCLVVAEAASKCIGLFLRSPNLRRRLARAFGAFSSYFPLEANLLRQVFERSNGGNVDLVSFSHDRPAPEQSLKILSDYGLITLHGEDQVRIGSGLLYEWLRQGEQR